MSSGPQGPMLIMYNYKILVNIMEGNKVNTVWKQELTPFGTVIQLMLSVSLVT